MLESLSVSNYILIGSLETTFPEGLIIISGETGAGKSILLGALSLVLGAKADASMVGPQGEHCVVEAVFSVDEAVQAVLREADLPCDDGRLVLRRTVARSGRSRSFANDEPVSVNVLQELSALLVDIHSQHQTLRLADERFRLDALDLVAGTLELRNRCSVAWNRLSESRRALEQIQAQRALAQQEQDYNTARWERLQQAGLVPGELESLEAEQKQLAHAGDIKLLLCQAQQLLSPDGDQLMAPAQQLRESARLLEKASSYIPSLEALAQRLTSTRLEVEDLAAEVETVNSRTEMDPERLARVEERLSLLYDLLQKHGVSTLEQLIAERDRLEGLVLGVAHLDEREAEARQQLEKAQKAHTELCLQLHRQRSAAAGTLAQAVQDRLHSLELERAVFALSLQDAQPGASGADTVQFLFAANGGTPADIGKAASGGELSRIMLSLKAVMARHKQLPTLVFDEIDTGVSGSAADKMGSLVCELGQHMQVFAITHLPQVAAKGHAHYLVSKQADVTSVRQLDAEGRVQELARMLSGATITPAAVANARALLNA